MIIIKIHKKLKQLCVRNSKNLKNIIKVVKERGKLKNTHILDSSILRMAKYAQFNR